MPQDSAVLTCVSGQLTKSLRQAIAQSPVAGWVSPSAIEVDIGAEGFDVGGGEDPVFEAGGSVIELEIDASPHHGLAFECDLEALAGVFFAECVYALAQEGGVIFVALMAVGEQGFFDGGAEDAATSSDKFLQNRAEIAAGKAGEQNATAAVFGQAAWDILGKFGLMDGDKFVAGFAVVAEGAEADGVEGFFEEADT